MSSQAAKDHAKLIEFLTSSVVLTEESDEAPKVSHHLLKPARDADLWTCPQLIPHPALIYADNRSNLTGDVPPIAECLRRVL